MIHVKTYKQFIGELGLTEGNYMWRYPKVKEFEGRRMPSAPALKGLEYTVEDTEAMNDYLLITPYTVDADSGELVVPQECPGRPPCLV